ncbi:hypothetical protein Mapa_018528 [Marchantia paleacea]|nr:hypothetical protein Mapa_018528 [Marchantia paleacea]
MSGGQAGSGILALTVALSLLCSLELSCAQKPGFISIDCGGTRNYTDRVTGIQWVTDDGYIETGTNVKVTTNLDKSDNLEALKTSRCFPPSASGARKKNCYTLPVTPGSTYLVRASTLHGTGPASRNTIFFQGSIDSTSWVNVAITASIRNTPLWAEAVIIAQGDTTSICVQDVGEGTPCLTSLELRPLGNAYRNELQSNILALVRRFSCGAEQSFETIRYPLDEFDRRWEGTHHDSAFSSAYTNQPRINTTLPLPDNVMAALNEDRPPLSVMQNAIESKDFGLLADTGVYAPQTTKCRVRLYVWDFVPYTGTDATALRQFESFQTVGMEEEGFAFLTFRASDTVTINSTNVTVGVSSDFTLFNFRSTILSQRPAMLNAMEVFADIPLQPSAYPNDVSALLKLQNDFGLSPLWAGDPCSPHPWDWIKCGTVNSVLRVISIDLTNVKLKGGISPSLWNLTELVDLWLTGNELDGTIPSELSSLKKLRTLHLNNNSLTGSVPASLADLPELIELYINDNDLSGTLPRELLNSNKLQIKSSGNPKLQCDGACDTRKGGSKMGLIIGAVCGSMVIVVIAICAFMHFYLRPGPKTDNQADLLEKNELSSVALVPPDPGHKAAVEQGSRTFTLAEIKAATKDFHTMIAEGGFGPVYYGKLANGQEVAVKVHKASGNQGAKEFFMEVDLLSRIHHRNLVSLVGHCQESQEQILVYAYMKKGTVRDHLYGGARRCCLDWRTRLEIALDSARGLAYLHTGCQPPIIHRDVKSNNILLDDKMRAKVADFGISKVTGDDQTAVETLIKGTIGYLDPEYFSTQRLTVKSDVYSFGVVLLEIVTGRPPIAKKGHLKDMVQGFLRDNDMKAIADPALEGDYYIEAIWKVVELGLECLENDPADRPDMLGVLRGVTEAMELERGARAYQQPSSTRMSASSSSSAASGGRKPSDQLHFNPSFRPRSSEPSMSTSTDFVTGLIPR